MTGQAVRRLNRFFALIRDHSLILVVVTVAAIVWMWVFNRAAAEFLANPNWPRAVWNGEGSINLFGYSFSYHLEGWADYDYFYVSWSQQLLSGRVPYTDEFNLLVREGTDYNVIYFFPPLYAYLCALGEIIRPDIGIGLLISIFGFLTALPVYGIGSYLSMNQRVGAVSAAMYLFNPIVLYHTAFEWLNPAPFVFFTVLSFYLLMKNRRISGVIAMVIAAFFKQTAFFLALPVIAVILKQPPRPEETTEEATEENNDPKRLSSDDFDFRGLAKIVCVVLVFAGALSIPYLFDPVNYVYYVFQRAGATLLTDFTNPPPINYPITPAVVLVVLGAPEWLIQAVNLLTYYTIGLILGILPLLAMMLLEVKDDRNLVGYWRRILYLTLLLIFWVHIFSPRGIYKYYLVALVPYFSILSTSGICRKESKPINVSAPMIVLPSAISLLVLVPTREFYLFFLFLIVLGYILHRPFSEVYGLIASPIRKIGSRIMRAETPS
ncbi:MAG: hypothetical protein AM324_005825 [Candidatus Thorarchaeota archaeon SMTZ1-83]|nr:MAG: hypothetical protein AM324_06970 [Candidatus Thorarchaeota archaeon SMTZ1-83]